MKVSGVVLSLTVIAAVLYYQIHAAPFGPAIPTTCCLNFTRKIIPSQFLIAHRTTRSGCIKTGVIFTTKRGYKICANPKEQWVQQTIKKLDNQKAKTQSA